MKCSDNAVFVGKKYFMRYVLAVLYKLFVEHCNSVRIRALGRNISRAVLAATSVQFLLRELGITRVSIGTVSFITEGRSRNVSSIEIELRIRDYIP